MTFIDLAHMETRNVVLSSLQNSSDGLDGNPLKNKCCFNSGLNFNWASLTYEHALTILLCLGSCWKLNLGPSLKSPAASNRFCFMILCNPSSYWLISFPVSAKEKHSQSMMLLVASLDRSSCKHFLCSQKVTFCSDLIWLLMLTVSPTWFLKKGRKKKVILSFIYWIFCQSSCAQVIVVWSKASPTLAVDLCSLSRLTIGLIVSHSFLGRFHQLYLEICIS